MFLKFTVLFAVGLFGFHAFAANAVTTSLSSTVGSRSEYYIDAGQYFSVAGHLTYESKNHWIYSLSQSATAVAEVEGPDDQSEWFNNLSASLWFPALYKGSNSATTLGLTATPFQYTRTSIIDSRFFDMTANVNHSVDFGTFSLSAQLAYGVYFYKYELDQNGLYNYPSQMSFSFSLAKTWIKILNSGFQYSLIERSYFDGERAYYYQMGLNQSLRINDSTTVAAGISTSDSQLAGRDSSPVYLYKENLSEVFLQVSYKI